MRENGIAFSEMGTQPAGEMEGFCSGHFEFNLQREMWKRWLVTEVGVEESHCC